MRIFEVLVLGVMFCSSGGHRSSACRPHPDGTCELNTPLRSKLRVLNPEVCIIKYFVMGVYGEVVIQLHSEEW
jgi:hypothetical protein